MIGYYVHHQGRGHLHRATVVARALDDRFGERVTGLSSVPPPPDWRGDWVRLARDDDPAPADADGTDVTARGVLHWVPRHHGGLRHRMAQVSRWIDETRPAALVVDVSVEIAALARLHGTPVIVMGQPGIRRDAAHRLGCGLADAIIAPWPAGSFADESWSLETAWPDRVTCVGAFSRLDECAADSAERWTSPAGGTSDGWPRRVTLLWGAGGEAPTPARLDAIREATPGTTWDIAAGGAQVSSQEVWHRLLASDIVVAHAGQNVVAEIAAAARRACVLAQPRPFGEQEATARELDRRGLAVVLERWPTPTEWPEVLASAGDMDPGGWRDWNDLHGAERAADVIARVARA